MSWNVSVWWHLSVHSTNGMDTPVGFPTPAAHGDRWVSQAAGARPCRAGVSWSGSCFPKYSVFHKSQYKCLCWMILVDQTESKLYGLSNQNKH